MISLKNFLLFAKTRKKVEKTYNLAQEGTWDNLEICQLFHYNGRIRVSKTITSCKNAQLYLRPCPWWNSSLFFFHYTRPHPGAITESPIKGWSVQFFISLLLSCLPNWNQRKKIPRPIEIWQRANSKKKIPEILERLFSKPFCLGSDLEATKEKEEDKNIKLRCWAFSRFGVSEMWVRINARTPLKGIEWNFTKKNLPINQGVIYFHRIRT